eukprot:189862-Hanusia_phi.AAC.1
MAWQRHEYPSRLRVSELKDPGYRHENKSLTSESVGSKFSLAGGPAGSLLIAGPGGSLMIRRGVPYR